MSSTMGPGGGGPEAEAATRFRPRLRRRRLLGIGFAALCLAATVLAVMVLAVLLVDVARDGAGYLTRDFLTGFPSRAPSRAGLKPAILGTLWVLAATAVCSFPLGVASAIWLEEYAPRNRLTQFIQINIANLAGVPSIVYGILGLAVFVRTLAMGRSVIAGALTLTLLILPVIIIASQEALRAVPPSIRLGAYGLGATRWQVVRHQVLPLALPGILTGTILALSRAIGETAPLIMVGALAFVPFVPRGLLDQFTVIPLQVFNWIGRPQAEFHDVAAAGIIVLLALLLTMNAAAIVLRNKYTKRL